MITALAGSRERLKRWMWVRRWKVKQFFAQRWREVPTELLLAFWWVLRRVVPGVPPIMHGRLYARVWRGEEGRWYDLGCVGCHLVVTAGKNFVAGAFNNVNEPETLKYHGFGTGTTAAAAGDTTLQTELTTQYNPDNTRPTGSQANSTNTYTTIATLSPDTGGTIAVTEWGLFSATTAGTLLDRQVFTAVNLVAGSDSLQTTYVLTIN
jgi:hypothetical protein